MATPRAIPVPPPKAPAQLPELVTSRTEIWRLHWEPDLRKPRLHAKGKFRFDAPNGQYAVSYGNEDEHGCFGEVYGDRQSIPPKDLERLLSRITPKTALSLAPLENGEFLKALHPHLDGRISSDVHYTVTRAWSLALHDWFPRADGIRYLARHATPQLSYCLFLDRCAGKLAVEGRGKLGDLRETVIRACAAYGLAPRLFEERDKGGW